MATKIEAFRDLPISVLVDTYLTLSIAGPDNTLKATKQEEYDLYAFAVTIDKYSYDVLASMADPDTVIQQTIDYAKDMLAIYPHHENTINFISLFAQAKIWIGYAHSIFKGGVTKDLGLIKDLIETNSKVARLLLLANIADDCRQPETEPYMVQALKNAGQHKIAQKLEQPKANNQGVAGPKLNEIIH